MLKERGQFGLPAQENHLAHLESTQGGKLKPPPATAPMTDAQRLDARFVQMCVAGAQGADRVYRLDAVGRIRSIPADRLEASCGRLATDPGVRGEWLGQNATRQARDIAACRAGGLLMWRIHGVEPDATQDAETLRLCQGYTALPTYEDLSELPALR